MTAAAVVVSACTAQQQRPSSGMVKGCGGSQVWDRMHVVETENKRTNSKWEQAIYIQNVLKGNES